MDKVLRDAQAASGLVGRRVFWLRKGVHHKGETGANIQEKIAKQRLKSAEHRRQRWTSATGPDPVDEKAAPFGTTLSRWIIPPSRL